MSDTINLERTHVEQDSSRMAMNWVNGAWVDAAKRSDSYDPATGQRIGTYAHAVRADTEVAVQAAVGAFKSTDWKDNCRLRAKVLNQLADRFEARREDLIEILSLENGKVRSEAAFEVDMIPSKFRYWASVVLTDYGRALEVLPGHFSVVTRSAIGVAGIIAPFNSPLVLTVRSLAKKQSYIEVRSVGFPWPHGAHSCQAFRYQGGPRRDSIPTLFEQLAGRYMLQRQSATLASAPIFPEQRLATR